MMPASSASGGSSGAPSKYCMVYTPPGGQLRSSVVLLLHLHSMYLLGHHNNFSPTTSRASIVGRWGTLIVNAASPSKAAHHEL
jgi:hypothetical protein